MLAVVGTASVVVLAAVHDLHLDSFNEAKVSINTVTWTQTLYLVITHELSPTVTMFSIRSQLIGSVAHAGVGAQRVAAAVSTVGLFFTLVDICDKWMLKTE